MASFYLKVQYYVLFSIYLAYDSKGSRSTQSNNTTITVILSCDPLESSNRINIPLYRNTKSQKVHTFQTFLLPAFYLTQVEIDPNNNNNNNNNINNIFH